jgi:integrase
MARPRKLQLHLPACVYHRHGAYWHVVGGKWHRLGADLAPALSEYARRISRPADKMPGLLARWLDNSDVADSTRHTYAVIVRQLSAILAEFEPHQVTARDILAVMHHHRKKPGMANHMRSVLIGALDLAFLESLVERNVARDVRPLRMAARDRYLTDEEFAAIHGKATPTLQAIMDLCYLTGQRISDVLAIRHADLGNEGITFRQQKTKHRMIVAWSPDLEAVVARTKSLHQSLRGLNLLHTRRGTPFTYSTVRTLWDRACNAAGVGDAHIHDIRAKAATDARAQGLDSQALLGHASESSHLRYLRSKETPIAQPVNIGQSKTKATGTRIK